MRLPLPRRGRRAAARDLDAREDDVVGVEEAVLVEADVHERRLEAGQDVVDLALVDVSDDRPAALALDVELGDPPVVGLFRCRLPPEGLPSDSRIATLVSPRSTETSNCFLKKISLHKSQALAAAVSRACACIDCRRPIAISVVITDEPP